MKKCRNCGNENSDEMNFCLECGTPLPAASSPSFTNPQKQSDIDTVAFDNKSVQTVVGQRLSPARPQNNKKIFLIVGGILSLLLLLFLGGAGLVFYTLKQRNTNVSSSSPPQNVSSTPGIADKSPTPRPSASQSDLLPDELQPLSDAPLNNAPPLPSPQITPTVSFTPPKEATKKGTFTISGNGGWQLSDVNIVPLETFQTLAQGSVDLAGIEKNVSSAGIAGDDKSKSRRIYPEYPTGALLMRTRFADGKFSKVQPVTAPPSIGVWENLPDERGRLEFCVNDNAPEKNNGQFTVSVIMWSAPKRKK